MNQQTALQAAIINRRHKLMSSVLRSNGAQQDAFDQELQDSNEHEDLRETTGLSVLIDCNALCDDIYVCDWA